MAIRYHKATPFLVAVAAMQLLAFATNCNCPVTPTDVAVEFTGLEVNVYDNGGTTPIPITDSIAARALALQVTPIWMQSERTASLFAPPEYMYGCPAPPEIYHHLDTIAGVEVMRLGRTGEARNVNSAFVAAMIEPDVQRTFSSIRETEAIPGMINGDGFQHLEPIYRPITYLLLRKDIDAMKGDHVRFIVRLTLTDGRSRADTTDPITLH